MKFPHTRSDNNTTWRYQNNHINQIGPFFSRSNGTEAGSGLFPSLKEFLKNHGLTHVPLIFFLWDISFNSMKCDKTHKVIQFILLNWNKDGHYNQNKRYQARNSSNFLNFFFLNYTLIFEHSNISGFKTLWRLNTHI